VKPHPSTTNIEGRAYPFRVLHLSVARFLSPENSMTSLRKWLVGSVMLTSALLLTGCGEKLYKAGGKITVDGRPVKEGLIEFHPKSGRTVVGAIKDGTFTLSHTSEGDGIPAGEYKVVIQADIWVDGKLTKEQENEIAMMKKNGVLDEIPKGGHLVHVVPREYNTVATTPLSEKIDGTKLEFVYDIVTKGKK
jgi:hypothetical protein